MMENPDFVPLFSLQDLPPSFIEDPDSKKFFLHLYLVYFWTRNWNLFWLPAPPQCHDLGPTLMVTYHQAMEVLNSFDIALPAGVLTQARDAIDKLSIKFDNWEGLPKPLGRFDTKAKVIHQLSLLRAPYNLRRANREMGEMCAERQVSGYQLDEGIWNILMIAEINRLKDPRWSHQRTMGDRQAMTILSLTLTWFGLSLVPPPPFASNEYQLSTPSINDYPSWPAFRNPVFISLDCRWREMESYGLRKGMIEVGISTLDSRSLFNVSPGSSGTPWKTRIQSHHLRVAEHANLIRWSGIQGPADTFQWGYSKIVEESRIGHEIDTLLNYPDRNLILVLFGDDDIVGQVLKTSSVNIRYFKPNIDPQPPHLHVSHLHRILLRTQTEWTLENALKNIGEQQPQFLLNAGNSARWTMHLLIRIVLLAASSREDTRKNLDHPGLIDMSSVTNGLTLNKFYPRPSRGDAS